MELDKELGVQGEGKEGVRADEGVEMRGPDGGRGKSCQERGDIRRWSDRLHRAKAKPAHLDGKGCT